jgi:hypothetical protein
VLELTSAFGFGSVFGSIVSLLLKEQLLRRKERHDRRVETDRATCHERRTRLIVANLSAFIRSNRCREGERDELAALIQNLSDGDVHVRFLDPAVQVRWAAFVKLSATCGWQRLSGVITELEITEYTAALESWRSAARRSFGPLLESDPPRLRKTAQARAQEEAA